MLKNAKIVQNCSLLDNQCIGDFVCTNFSCTSNKKIKEIDIILVKNAKIVQNRSLLENRCIGGFARCESKYLIKKMKEAKSHLVDDRLFFYLFFPLAMNK